MPTLAIALVLTAAVLHAGWNVLLKTSGDTLWTAVRLQLIGTAILLPVGIAAWVGIGRPAVPMEALVLAIVSGVLEAIYFVCLSAAYSRGALSLVYPLARGSAPLLVALPWRALQAAGAEHRGAIGFALATGASIAAYSAVDRLGVRLTEPWLYGSILAVAATTFLAITVILGRRVGFLAPAPIADPAAPPAKSPLPAGALRDAIAGVLALAAYLLVLV